MADVLLKIVLAADMIKLALRAWLWLGLVVEQVFAVVPPAICKEDMVQFIDFLHRLLVRLALL